MRSIKRHVLHLDEEPTRMPNRTVSHQIVFGTGNIFLDWLNVSQTYRRSPSYWGDLTVSISCKGKDQMKGIYNYSVSAFAAITVLLLSAFNVFAAGDPELGKKAFLACVSCHSAKAGLHKTGPSLANIWGKNAGTVDGFNRYSKAVRNSKIVWNDETLDAWLRNPRALVPNTSMRIRGVAKANERQNIVAYLKQLATGGATTSANANNGADPADLSKPWPEHQVTALKLCQDTYTVTMRSGEVHKFWEFNLRLKTDSSAKGPPKGRPILIGSGMRGDRAFLVFASPAEISPFIKEKC